MHDVPSDDDGGKKIFAAAWVFFTERKSHGNRGGTRVAAGCEADVVELATLTECGVHECRIQGRNFGAIVDHGAFAAAAHFGNVSIGNLVPLQSRADQLDADLVEDAVFSLFNRLAWNIFKSHPGCAESELFSGAGCHVSFPRGLTRRENPRAAKPRPNKSIFPAKALRCKANPLASPSGKEGKHALSSKVEGRGIFPMSRTADAVPFYARFAFANSAALVPAKRPKTAPFIKPDPPG